MISRLSLTTRGLAAGLVITLLFIAAQWSNDSLAPLLDMTWRVLLMAGLVLSTIDAVTDPSRRVLIDSVEGETELGAVVTFELLIRSEFRHRPRVRLRFKPSEGWRCLAVPDRRLLEVETRLPVTLQPVMTGRQTPGELHLRIPGRFGLIALDRLVQLPGAMDVVTAHRTGRPHPGNRMSPQHQPDRVSGNGFELHRLRDYQPGDSLRQVDWKATARSGRKIVRLFTEENQFEVCLMLDASQYGRIQIGAMNRFAHMQNVAARLAGRTLSAGDGFTLCTYGAGIESMTSAGRGLRGAASVRQTIIRARTQDGPANHLSAYLEITRKLPRRVLLVFLTHLDHSALNDHLLRTVELARTRHMVLIASILDQELEQLVSRYPDEWTDPFTSLAAAQQIEATELQLANLRRIGTRIVHAQAAALDQKVMLAYEDIKARRQVA